MIPYYEDGDILPIIQTQEIGKGGSATIYKILIEEEYNSLLPVNRIRNVRTHIPQLVNLSG